VLGRLVRSGIIVVVVGSVLAVGGGPAGAATPMSLEGPTWVLDQEASNLEAVAPEFVVTALFDDGALSGTSGCNNYNTTYTATRTRLRVNGAISQTLKACSGPAGNVEASYLERIPTARAFSIRRDRLTIRTSTKGADLIYRALSAKSLLGDWEVTSYFRPGAIVSVAVGTEITATFDAKSISGNGGCNDYGGKYEADETKIEIGPIAATQRACLEANVTQQESDYFAALELVRTFTLDSNGLTFLRADGGIAVTMTRRT
jgi:heat shock protein HslJ